MRRVVVTGLGTVNALAPDVPGTFAALREGRCGIGALTFRDADRLTIRIGAEVRDWDAAARFSRHELALYDPVTQYAMVAGVEALAMAGLTGPLGPRAGVILGTAAGGIQTPLAHRTRIFQRGDPNTRKLGTPWPAYPSQLRFDATATDKAISVQ